MCCTFGDQTDIEWWKKYNLPLIMTENEMTKKLGYEKIWNCGLLKYVWKKK